MKPSSTPLSADIPPELRDYLASVPPVSKLELDELRKAAAELDRDPKFQADYLKGLFVNLILEAMAEQNISASELARRWNRSRQYLHKLLNEDQRVNFTIETMVELALLLDRRVHLQVLRQNEANHVIRCVPRHREIEPLAEQWPGPATRRHPLDDVSTLFGASTPVRSALSSIDYDNDDLAA